MTHFIENLVYLRLSETKPAISPVLRYACIAKFQKFPNAWGDFAFPNKTYYVGYYVPKFIEKRF